MSAIRSLFNQTGSSKMSTGELPEPSQQGPCDWDQYDFTEPESRIMKVRGGFE